MCHIYIYIYTSTHGHTHTFSCRPHSLLCCCAWEPLSVNASTATATAPPAARTHKKRDSRTDIFSHCSSKPYHESLHSCSLSISISQHRHQALACIVLIVFPRVVPPLRPNKLRWESNAEALFLQILLSPFCRGSERVWVVAGARLSLAARDHYVCVSPQTFCFHDVSTGQDSSTRPPSLEEQEKK